MTEVVMLLFKLTQSHVNICIIANVQHWDKAKWPWIYAAFSQKEQNLKWS